LCIYSLALGRNADQDIVYKELKGGEEKWPPNMLKLPVSQPKIWTKGLLFPVQKEEQFLEVR
jgi:hypothetical protein